MYVINYMHRGVDMLQQLAINSNTYHGFSVEDAVKGARNAGGKVDSVYAVGTKNQYGVWDHVMTTLTMRNNSKVFVEASHRMPEGFPFTMSFRAQSSQGTIDFDLAAGENIENINDSKNRLVYYTNQMKSNVPVENTNAFQNELSYFVNCIENNQDNNLIPLKDVLYTLKVLKAIENSLEIGLEVRVK